MYVQTDRQYRIYVRTSASYFILTQTLIIRLSYEYDTYFNNYLSPITENRRQWPPKRRSQKGFKPPTKLRFNYVLQSTMSQRWFALAVLILKATGNNRHSCECVASDIDIDADADADADVYNITNHQRHQHYETTIHNSVLPPEPDEEPERCSGGSLCGDLCGTERFCAPLFSTSPEESLFCLHKTLFPLTAKDVAVIAMTFLSCCVAAMAGIGGGGLVFPIIVLILNFTPKEASVISNTAVFGNGLAQFLLNRYYCKKSSSDSTSESSSSSSSSIVYSTVLMMLPGLLAGGSATLALEGLVPQTLILILALLTLAMASIKTSVKAVKLQMEASTTTTYYNHEEEEEPMPIIMVEEEVSAPNLGEPSSPSRDEEMVVDSTTTDPAAADLNNNHDHRQGGLSIPSGHYRVPLLIVSCWLLNVITFLVIRLVPHLARCSSLYFTLVILPTVFCALFAWCGRIAIRRDRDNGPPILQDVEESASELQVPLLVIGTTAQELQRPLACSSGSEENEPNESTCFYGKAEAAATTTTSTAIFEIPSNHTNPNNTEQGNNTTTTLSSFELVLLIWWLPFASILIGSLSALLGIGGGELVGPVLLILNMDPQYSSITTATLSLLNSSTNMLYYIITGRMAEPNYKLLMGLAGWFGGGCGRGLALHIMGGRKSSFVAFCLALVLVVAAILILYELVTTPPSWTSQGVC